MERHITVWILCTIWIQLTTANINCPIAECECSDVESPSDERTIDCRDKDLLVIPAISASDEIFREITFSSANPSCRDDNTCSNRIIHVPDNAFAGLKVRKIDFSKNYLSSVEDNAFNGLENYLTELLLEGDDVNPIPFASLTNLTNLVTLELERFKQNGITSLPQDFPNLETLVLHTLQMTFISPTPLNGKLTKLKRLEIKDNENFINFPTSAIRVLTSLEHVSFVQNGLTDFRNSGNAFQSNPKLAELDLSHNHISNLDPGCFDYLQDKLQYLGLHLNYLDGSKLSPLANANWQKLEELILDSNPLGGTGIPNNLFKNMPTLANLNLQLTGLTHIEQNDFEGLTNLHFLHLSGNMITQIDGGTFINLPNLKELYLDSVGSVNNRLNFTKQTAEGLDRLETLDLLGSSFEADHFWSSLSVMVGLKKLILSNTGISNIPNFTFEHNRNLEYLDVKTNGLTELTQAQMHGLGGSLKSLNLIQNSITLIDECVVEDLVSLTQLSLSGNPLHCDCKLVKLYEWAKHSNFSYFLQAVCNSPPTLQNQQLLSLNKNQLVCSDNTPIQCQTFTTSTTSTTSTTAPPSPTIPLPHIILSIQGRNENGVTLSWIVQNVDQLTGFILTYEELGANSNLKTTNIDKTLRQWTQFLENTAADYRLCIKASTSDGRITIDVCVTSLGADMSTTLPPTVSPPAGLTGGEIAAIATGCTVLIILVVVIFFFLLRYQSKPKYKDTPPVQFTAVARPAVGYDSKRFSKPKKAPQVNGDIKISAISSGKTAPPSSPDSRHSAGSYQYLNENQMINIQPHLNYNKGANGTSHDLNPSGYQNNPKQREVHGYLKDPNLKTNFNSHEKSIQSRYDKTPGQGQVKGLAPQKPNQYVNDPQRTSDSVYTNDIKDRPLPKPRTKHYENNNSSGFLNHGFDLDSPTENTYYEINPETQI